MDIRDLDSFLNNSEMECTNEWEIGCFGDKEWDQYIQEPSSENSCLESPKNPPPSNNLEESERSHGMKRSSSYTNTPTILSFGDPTSPIELETVPAPVIKNEAPKRSKTTWSRPDFAHREHVLAERRRREKITDNLYALSGLVPGLKKRDKASVLTKTIEYVKQLEEKVKALEERVAISVEAEPVSVASGAEQSPKFEIKVVGKTYLIKMHFFQAGRGALVKALNAVESLDHMRLVTANSIQFSEQILDLTITAEVEEGFEGAMKDIFQMLKSALENSG